MNYILELPFAKTNLSLYEVFLGRFENVIEFKAKNEEISSVVSNYPVDFLTNI
jgi:serine protease inhibitor